jgi:hypothetical protein
MRRSRHRVERDRPAAADEALLRLLRTITHSPVAEQGRAHPSADRRAARGSHRGDSASWRASSPVRTASGLTQTAQLPPGACRNRRLRNSRRSRPRPWKTLTILENRTGTVPFNRTARVFQKPVANPGFDEIEFLVGTWSFWWGQHPQSTLGRREADVVMTSVSKSNVAKKNGLRSQCLRKRPRNSVKGRREHSAQRGPFVVF